MLDTANSMFQLADEEIKLKRGFGFGRVGIGHHDVGEDFAEVLEHRGFALGGDSVVVEREELALERSDTGESLNDGEGGLSCTRTLDNCFKHVESTLGEHLVIVL